MNPFLAAANAVTMNAAYVLGTVFRHELESKSRRGQETGERLLKKVLRENRNSEFGRKHGFADIHSVEEFRARVPLSVYEDYEDYIRRTRETGEQNLMTSHRVVFLAATSGTTSKYKFIPQTNGGYVAYFKIICIALTLLRKQLKRRGYSTLTARGLVLVNMSHHDIGKPEGEGIPVGMVSSFGADSVAIFLPVATPYPKELNAGRHLPDTRYLKCLFGLRDPDLKFTNAPYASGMMDVFNYLLEHSEELVNDIERGGIRASEPLSPALRARLSRKLPPDPKRARELREIFAHPERGPVLSRVWPMMSLIITAGGGEFALHARQIHELFDPDVAICQSGYVASECTMGVALTLEEPVYSLLPGSAYYEFLPVVDGVVQTDRVLTAQEVVPGEYYEVVITTNAGLYRYRMRDIVCIDGFEGTMPLLRFSHRSQYITDFLSMHLSSEQLGRSVMEAAEPLNVHIADFCLRVIKEGRLPYFELFVEPEQPLTPEQREAFAEAFEKRLNANSWDYEELRRDGDIGPTRLRVLQPGAFRRYREKCVAEGASASQIKTMRRIDTPEKLAFFESEEEKDA